MSDIILNPPASSNPLPVWTPGAALPAYLSGAAAELPSNMPERNTVPSLSYEGKVWQIVKGGDKQKLQSRNAENDLVPVSVMRVVVLGLAARRGRAFYEGGYDPTKPAQPKCWSTDGEAPDEAVKEKQASICKTCPQSAKGSKILDGREMAACSQHRILCVAPGFDIGGEPLRLKIAITSDWDKEVVEHGWFAFQQYMDFLRANGINHSGLVITKVKFDVQAQYPKLLFAVDRPLTPEEFAQMQTAIANPKVAEILADKWTPAGVNGVDSTESDTAPAGARPKPTDPQHIAHGGTDNELWWNGTAWEKPWLSDKPAEPAPPPASQQIVEHKPAQPRVPKPTDPTHIHAAGTSGEKWWNGSDWVSPWEAEEPAPAPAPASAPAPAPEPSVVAAVARPKPTDPSHIHLGGTADEQWWNGSAWEKPWVAEAPAPAAPPAPPAPPPAPEPVVATRPRPEDLSHYHAVGTDGEMWWNGTEWEKPWAPLASTAPAAPAAPGAADASIAAGNLPPEVQALMSKWS